MLALNTVDFADVADIVSDTWALEDKEEQKRRLHRIEMVKFRRKRKAKQDDLRGECRRLEKHAKQVAASVRALASRNAGSSTRVNILRELFVEIEDLRQQNGALRKQVSLHTAFKQVLIEAEQDNAQQDESLLPSTDEHSGWRVRFPSGEPSFYFHPFTRDAFDSIMDACTSSLEAEPTVNLGGEFLGWNVLQATASSTVEDHSLVAKSRFTKRIRCSLLEVDDVMSKEDRNSWPLIVTPMDWSGVMGRASVQVLQEFDDNTCVLVHNAQGSINLRYICLVRRHRWTEREGKRVITYTMRVADSDSNKRSRLAEADEDEVQWITEGGTQLTIAEVDGRTVDVVYDHWGGCESELHAQYLFVQWAHYALRWEQMVLPSNLLPAEGAI
ncbi:hypothetical protein F444_09201 [Phytophthora nicotianae P1976]|uniref:BZIP domain-containing protein n=1 Tax=Phytophthora nicotianae P1976 TaxID=1317066 RepID=A0A081A8F5_PHYNI|nr:hypothetical protein F444_09201 [Phytophthora nicotianae P1976]